ncbi:MAG: flagellar biosynthesis protein FlhF [Lachnospiraceae bacterium]|nr:flagellar biosynthesis protein FlhF [Lachnospiraceae bacterium]
MIIKKFNGKTEADAIEAAKKELGNGVVVMNVKEVKKKGLLALFGTKQVEVTVALEEENVKPVLRMTERAAALEAQALKAKTNVTAKKSTETESLEKRLDSLQSLLEIQMRRAEEEKNAALKSEYTKEIAKGEEKAEIVVEEAEVSPEEQERNKFIRLLYNTMITNEVDEKYANQILEDIDKTKKHNMPMDYILANTYQKMILKFGKAGGITPAENNPKVIFFIGPTGVGKTTTIAKIASRYSVEEKKKVALLTSDTYRIAATEQLRIYANILEVPFRIIYTQEDLQKSVEDFKEYDYIFVDTMGHSHQNNEQLQNTKDLLDSMKGQAEYQTFLVLSATTKYQDLLRITDKYKDITESQLIFTKLDETDRLGNLLNMKLYTGSTIAYVAHGQNVPNDIEDFNPQKTVKQLLGGKN